MRVNKMITKKNALIYYQTLSTIFFKEMYEGQYGEFICGYWGLKTIVLEGLSKILSRA